MFGRVLNTPLLGKSQLLLLLLTTTTTTITTTPALFLTTRTSQNVNYFHVITGIFGFPSREWHQGLATLTSYTQESRS